MVLGARRAHQLDIETFEIFAPDVLATLIDKAKGYDFEFIENHLYIFQSTTITKRKDLHALLVLAQYLIATISPRLMRLQDDIMAIQLQSRAAL